MSSAICIGSIFSFLLGGYFNWQASTLDVWSHVGVVLFLLWVGFREKINLLVAAWVYFWVSMHSPPAWRAFDETGMVVVGGGCGNSEDDLLVSVNSHLYLARGGARQGDVVKANANIYPGASALINVLVPVESETRLCQLSNKLRSLLVRRFIGWPDGERQWLESFVLGISSRLDYVTLQSLKYLGLLHIVVLSGSHVTLISSILLVILRVLPLIGYCCRIVTMRTWPLIWSSSSILACCAVVLFALAVGFGQSIQRSLIIFLLCNMLPNWLLRVETSWQRLKLAWSIQCIFFSINLWSLSNFLTWSGTIILLSNRDLRSNIDFIGKIFGNIRIQFYFGIMALLIFSQSGLFQIIANVLLCPLFSLALILNLWVLIAGPDYLSARLIVDFQLSILSLVRHLAFVAKSNEFLTIRAPEWLGRNTLICKIFTAILLAGLLFKVQGSKNVENN